MKHIDRFLKPPKKPERSPEVVSAYRASHPRCACCWIPNWAVRFGRHLTVQHVIRGVRRSDEWCCLLVYCWQCHRLADDGFRIPMAGGKYWPSLSLGAQLTIKQETDPEEWNPARLAELYRQTLPELEPIPKEFIRERSKWT